MTEQLDRLSTVLQLSYLMPGNKTMSEVERAMHADELREIVERMKAYIDSMAKK